jgi:hypothetical protein
MRSSAATAVFGSSFADTQGWCPLLPSGFRASSESAAPPLRRNWSLVSRPLGRWVTPRVRSSGRRFRAGFRRLASARSPRTPCIESPNPRRQSFRPCSRRVLPPSGGTAASTPGRRRFGHRSMGRAPFRLASFVRVQVARSILVSSHTPLIAAKAMLCAWSAPWRRQLSRRGSWFCIRRCFQWSSHFCRASARVRAVRHTACSASRAGRRLAARAAPKARPVFHFRTAARAS